MGSLETAESATAAARKASSAVFAAGARFVPEIRLVGSAPNVSRPLSGFGMSLEGLVAVPGTALAVLVEFRTLPGRSAAIRRISAVAASACACEGSVLGPHPIGDWSPVTGSCECL